MTRGVGLSDAILGLVAVGSIIASALQLQISARYASAASVAAILKPGDAKFAPLAAKFSEQTESIVSDKVCRSDILNVGMNYVLADIDRQDALSDYEGWSKSLDRGERFLSHALSCSPNNGDYWGRLAMVHRANGAGSDDIGALTDRAVLYAPSEMPAVAARFALWNHLPASVSDRTRFSIDHDLRTLLFYAPRYRVRDIAKTMSTAVASAAVPFVQSLPEDRRAELSRAKVSLGDLSSDATTKVQPLKIP